MTPELDQKLCTLYPKIMAERELPMTQTCMCWGFECDDGWYQIIASAMDQIQHHIDFTNKRRELLMNDSGHDIPVPEEVRQVVFTQVKEKFGQLRIYYNGGDDHVRGIIRMAEAMSMHTCEVCGSPGKMNNGPWIRTLCEQHDT